MLSADLMEMCRSYEQDMQELRRHADLLHDMAGSLSVSTDGNAGGGQGVSDRTGRYALKLAEAEEIILVRGRMHEHEQEAVCRLIEGIGPLEGRVLHRYYVRGDTLQGVAKKLSYSVEYVRRKRRQGLDMLPQSVPDGYLPKEYAKWHRRYQRYAAKIFVQ